MECLVCRKVLQEVRTKSARKSHFRRRSYIIRQSKGTEDRSAEEVSIVVAFRGTQSVGFPD